MVLPQTFSILTFHSANLLILISYRKVLLLVFDKTMEWTSVISLSLLPSLSGLKRTFQNRKKKINFYKSTLHMCFTDVIIIAGNWANYEFPQLLGERLRTLSCSGGWLNTINISTLTYICTYLNTPGLERSSYGNVRCSKHSTSLFWFVVFIFNVSLCKNIWIPEYKNDPSPWEVILRKLKKT